MAYLERLLRKAQWFLLNDEPLPLDLAVSLMEAGVIVDELTPDGNQTND